MARSRSAGAEISLFPFLSILACVIGTLTLMVAGLTVGEIVSPGVVRGEAMNLVQATNTDLSRELERLEQLVGEAETLARVLDEARRSKNELEGRRDAVIARRTALEEGREELQRKRAGLESDWAAIDEARRAQEAEAKATVDQAERERQRADELSADLAKAEEELAASVAEAERIRAEHARTRSKVIVRPQGSGKGLRPCFVECRNGEVVLDPDLPDKRKTLKMDGQLTADWVNFLAQVKARDNWILVMLIRPDGIPSFHQSLGLAIALDVRYGYLPLVGDGEIDFSVFFKTSLGVRWKPVPEGLCIVEVAAVNSHGEPSPAQACGLKQSDILVEAAGQVMRKGDDLRAVLASHKIGDDVAIVYLRNGARAQVTARLGAQ